MCDRRNFMMRTAGGLVLFTTPLATPGPLAARGEARGEPGDSPRTEGLSPKIGDRGQSQQAIPKRPPALLPDLVRDFVQKAHADLAGTQALLAEQPALLNATWDWGGGDFEAAIAGAGHMGNREIAQFLISQGARFDIFVAAMLGKLDYVQAAITTWPDLVHSKGPHGISLLRHARAGGQPAATVVEYLMSKGAV
jgi:hypothetical protein